MSFELHPRLEQDLTSVGNLPLSHVMLYPSTSNPWVVLVPKVLEAKEWHHLTEAQQSLLCREISQVSKWMESEFQPDKINVGALGNMVPQLHIHVVCRYKTDTSWPGAIWGVKQEVEARIFKELFEKLKTQLSRMNFSTSS